MQVVSSTYITISTIGFSCRFEKNYDVMSSRQSALRKIKWKDSYFFTLVLALGKKSIRVSSKIAIWSYRDLA